MVGRRHFERLVAYRVNDEGQIMKLTLKTFGRSPTGRSPTGRRRTGRNPKWNLSEVISRLTNLRALTLHHCGRFPNWLLLPNLTRLCLHSCDSGLFEACRPGTVDLPQLQFIKFENCRRYRFESCRRPGTIVLPKVDRIEFVGYSSGFFEACRPGTIDLPQLRSIKFGGAFHFDVSATADFISNHPHLNELTFLWSVGHGVRNASSYGIIRQVLQNCRSFLSERLVRLSLL